METKEETNKKKAIAEAFLQLIQKKPLEKITVKMLIENCCLSRSAFYYHFRSISGVAEYIILESLEIACRKCRKTNDLKEMIQFLLEPFEENRILIKKMGMSLENTEYWRYIIKHMFELNSVIWEENPAARLGTKDEQFISSMFTFGVLGYMLYNILNNDPIQPEYLAEQIVQFHDKYQEK